MRLVGAVGLMLCAAACSTSNYYDNSDNPYLRRADSMTADSGDASAANKAIHTISPWPPGSRDRNIPVSAERLSKMKAQNSNPASQGNPVAPP